MNRLSDQVGCRSIRRARIPTSPFLFLGMNCLFLGICRSEPQFRAYPRISSSVQFWVNTTDFLQYRSQSLTEKQGTPRKPTPTSVGFRAISLSLELGDDVPIRLIDKRSAVVPSKRFRGYSGEFLGHSSIVTRFRAIYWSTLLALGVRSGVLRFNF